MAETNNATQSVDAESNSDIADCARYPVWQPRLSRDFLEEHPAPIIEFTEAILAKNLENGIELKQDEVEFYFECQVRSAYWKDRANPMIEKLLSQRKIPMMLLYWEDHDADTAQLKSQQIGTEKGFHCHREASEDQLAADPGVLILENGKKSVVVPKVSLLTLSELEWDGFFKDLQEANDGSIPTHVARAVWIDMVKFTYFTPDEHARLITQKYAECKKVPSYSVPKPKQQAPKASSIASRKQSRTKSRSQGVDGSSSIAPRRGKDRVCKGNKGKQNS